MYTPLLLANQFSKKATVIFLDHVGKKDLQALVNINFQVCSENA